MAERKKRSVSILFENILYFIKNDTSLLNKLLNKKNCCHFRLTVFS